MNNELTSDYIIMARNLQSVTKHYQAILDVLNENTVLSGSIVLKTILGESWGSGDIDIFTTDKNLTKLSIGKWSENNTERYPFLKGIYQIYRGDLGNCTVDIIQVHSIKDCMEKYFDFDFCKCYFDGKQFCIMNPHSVLNKEMQVHPSFMENNKNTERIMKYLRRGFKIYI